MVRERGAVCDRIRSVRDLARFVVFLIGVVVFATRASLLLHEVLGHGVPYALLRVESVFYRLSPLGGGTTSCELAPGVEVGEVASRIVSMGGIVVNLVSGAIAWAIARRLAADRWRAKLLLLVFAACSVAQSFGYLAVGLFYGEGDPGALLSDWGLDPPRFVWLVPAAAIAPVAFRASREFLELLAAHADLEKFRRRVVLASLTMPLVLGAYFVVMRATALEDEPSLSGFRLETERMREARARGVAFESVAEEDVRDRVPPPLAPIACVAAAVAGAVGAGLRSYPRAKADAPTARDLVGSLVLGALWIALTVLVGNGSPLFLRSDS